ncbi:MAG: hypothetical protein ABEI58_03675 [Candidatus Nanohaloarchaea archaeon]
MIDESQVNVDHDDLMDIAKPLFYGFVFLTGISVNMASESASTFLGLSVLFSLTLISAGLAKSLEDDWEAFLEVIALLTLLVGIFFASFLTASFSLFV